MSKKTVSVLLLLILTIAIALFSFTSCKNEPEPTAAPRAGEIPPIPSKTTPISSIGEDELDTLSALFGNIGRFFSDYSETYEDSGAKPLYKLMNNPHFSLDKNISLFAAASSGSYGVDAEHAKGYEHGEIAGAIGVNEDGEFFLSVDAAVTTELFGWEDEDIHLEFEILNSDWIKVFIGEKEDYKTPDILFDFSDPNADFEVYKGGANTPLSDGDEKDACIDMLNFLLFLGVKSMSDATIEIDNVILTDTIPGDVDNIASFNLNGLVKLSGTLSKDAPTIYDIDEKHHYGISEFYSSFLISVESLSVKAAVATEVTLNAGKEDEEVKSELLAATLSVKKLALSGAFGDSEVTSLKCEKLSLSLSNNAADEADALSLSLELSNLDFTFEIVKQTFKSVARLMNRIHFGGSFTLGFAAMTGELSAGVVTDFDVTLGSLSSIPFISITPKAAVIDGKFYSTDDTKDLLIEYCDMALSFLRRLSLS